MTIHPDFVAGMAAWPSIEISLFGCGAGPRSLGEPAQNIDQLAVRIVGRIAEFVHRMSVGQLAQTDEFIDLLSPVQLQLGRPVGEQNADELAVTEQAVELGRRDIDQEQNEYPKLDRHKAIPG